MITPRNWQEPIFSTDADRKNHLHVMGSRIRAPQPDTAARKLFLNFFFWFFDPPRGTPHR